MRPNTLTHFAAYLANQAVLNNVTHTPGTELTFSVTPSVEQSFVEVLGESTAFLSQINIETVPEITGEALGVDSNGPLASRTNTDNSDRTPVVPTDVKPVDIFVCKKTDFDSYIKYGTLDAWAKHKDFEQRITNKIMSQIAQDKIMIGFNGVTAAADTNRANFPLLQDVNVGWLQKMRGQAKRYKKTITVYSGGNFNNIDGCVYDATMNMLDPWFRNDKELVVLASRDVINSKYIGIFDKADSNVNTLAGLTLHADRPTIAGMPVVDAPFLPAGTVMVTALKNLSIYTQEGSIRKTIVDNAKRDRIETYMSMNDAYVIEDFGRGLLLEDIQLEATSPQQ